MWSALGVRVSRLEDLSSEAAKEARCIEKLLLGDDSNMMKLRKKADIFNLELSMIYIHTS